MYRFLNVPRLHVSLSTHPHFPVYVSPSMFPQLHVLVYVYVSPSTPPFPCLHFTICIYVSHLQFLVYMLPSLHFPSPFPCTHFPVYFNVSPPTFPCLRFSIYISTYTLPCLCLRFLEYIYVSPYSLPRLHPCFPAYTSPSTSQFSHLQFLVYPSHLPFLVYMLPRLHFRVYILLSMLHPLHQCVFFYTSSSIQSVVYISPPTSTFPHLRQHVSVYTSSSKHSVVYISPSTSMCFPLHTLFYTSSSTFYSSPSTSTFPRLHAFQSSLPSLYVSSFTRLTKVVARLHAALTYCSGTRFPIHTHVCACWPQTDQHPGQQTPQRP